MLIRSFRSFRCDKETNEQHYLSKEEVNRIKQDGKEIGWDKTLPCDGPFSRTVGHCIRGPIDAKMWKERFAKSGPIGANMFVEKYSSMAEGRISDLKKY